MSTLTLNDRSSSPHYIVLLILALILGLGWMLITKDGPQPDEINDAIDQGITIPTAINGCNNFHLKDFKKPGIWRKQFRKRGFTVQKVSEILRRGAKETYYDTKSGRMMMRMIDPQSGDYIVLDPEKCEIWQIAPSDFLH